MYMENIGPPGLGTGTLDLAAHVQLVSVKKIASIGLNKKFLLSMFCLSL